RRVGRVGARAAAKHVARELIEHDQQRERARRRLLPGAETAGGGSLIDRQKALADRGVERIVLDEPLVGAGRLPEGDDLLGCYRRNGCLGRCRCDDRRGSRPCGALAQTRTSPCWIWS